MMISAKDYFKEVRELLEKVSQEQKELTQSQKKTDEQLKKTDKQFKKTDEQFKKTDEEIEKLTREVTESQKITDGQLKKTEEELRKSMKSLDQKIGKLTESWGVFAESLVAPGVPKILKKCDINIKKIYTNAESRVNGRQIEIDVMGIGTRNGHGVIVACSVKNRLHVFDVDDFIERLGEFRDFFPEYADRELIGLVGGIKVDEGLVRYAMRKGFYVLGSSEDVVKLLNKKDFSPKIWA